MWARIAIPIGLVPFGIYFAALQVSSFTGLADERKGLRNIATMVAEGFVRSPTDAKTGSTCRPHRRCVTRGFVRESVLRLLVSGFLFPLCDLQSGLVTDAVC